MAYDDAQLAAVLNDTRRIAIVGLSSRRESPSQEVARYLRRNGYRVIPVNPLHVEILGTRSYRSVADIPDAVDLVVVFRRPQDIPDVALDVIEALPKYLWLQLGIRHDEAAATVERHGVVVYQDICIEQTHQRLEKANVLKH